MGCFGALGIQWDPLKSNQLLDSGAWEDLKEYGAIVFRGFEISKDKGTFGQVRKIAEVPSRSAIRNFETSKDDMDLL